MRYCLSGTIGVGKTTLINKLKENYSIDVVEEPCRFIEHNGFSLTKGNMIETQLAMMSIVYSNIASNENAIFERGLLDLLVFTTYFYEKNQITNKQYKFFFDIISRQLYLFDKIFYIEPEFELENDGFRVTDKQFQKDIDDLFQRFIMKFRLDVIKLTGSVESRMQTIIQEIEELK